MEEHKLDFERNKKNLEVSAECKEVTNKDRCEAAYEIQKCVFEKSAEKGMKIEIFIT